MKHIPCPWCGSDRSRLYAADPNPKNLHPFWMRCKNCGLFYANPQASCDELAAYYSDYYAHGPFKSYTDDPKLERQALEKADAFLRKIKRYAPAGRFLDTGFGVGFMLHAARQAGYEVWGNELSAQSLEHTVVRWGLDRSKLHAGTLEEARFDSNFFDVVYAWHIIEHVTNLRAFMNELVRVLKPGGLLILGTENNLSFLSRSERVGRLLCGRIPSSPTATEHTVGFSLRWLKRIFAEMGFTILESRAREENLLGEHLKPKMSRHIEKQIVNHLDLYLRRYPVYYLSQILNIGRMIEIFARKR